MRSAMCSAALLCRLVPSDSLPKTLQPANQLRVENVDDLPDHIRASLTDEMLRRYRDPAPVNHDLYLRQKHRESIADTKRLWATLGVPEDIAGELAEDPSVGHRLAIPKTGILTVNARQGSGKTLAAHRLYQLALLNRTAGPFPAPACISERTLPSAET